MSTFKFSLKDEAMLPNGIVGEVVGRVEYTNSDNQYFLKYIDATGNSLRQWITEDDLTDPE